MTTGPYREACTPAQPAPPKPRREWRVMWGDNAVETSPAEATHMFTSLSIVAASVAWVLCGAAPFVIRWLIVSAVALFVWALCFVRRVDVPPSPPHRG